MHTMQLSAAPILRVHPQPPYYVKVIIITHMLILNYNTGDCTKFNAYTWKKMCTYRP